jgi:hypothetical protein
MTAVAEIRPQTAVNTLFLAAVNGFQTSVDHR